MALREGWRVPEGVIEEPVWSRAAARSTTNETALEVPDNDFEF